MKMILLRIHTPSVASMRPHWSNRLTE
jgi:hypothetical protein